MKHTTKTIQVPTTTYKDEKETTIVFNQRECAILCCFLGGFSGNDLNKIVKEQLKNNGTYQNIGLETTDPYELSDLNHSLHRALEKGI